MIEQIKEKLKLALTTEEHQYLQDNIDIVYKEQYFENNIEIRKTNIEDSIENLAVDIAQNILSLLISYNILKESEILYHENDKEFYTTYGMELGEIYSQKLIKKIKKYIN